MLLIPLHFACPQYLAATHLSSTEVSNGLSWPMPKCTCNAMVTSQAQHSTNEGVLGNNSAYSMLMRDDLRLPRAGIKPRPSGLREVGSTARLLPLIKTKTHSENCLKHFYLIDDHYICAFVFFINLRGEMYVMEWKEKKNMLDGGFGVILLWMKVEEVGMSHFH